MAVMTNAERIKTMAHVMRNALSFGSLSVTKPDLKAAVDAADDWAEANTASFTAALPQPFRGATSAQQKGLLLCWVIMRRVGLLRVEEDG